MPAVSVTRFVLFGETYSIIDGTRILVGQALRPVRAGLPFLGGAAAGEGRGRIWAWLAAADPGSLPDRLLRGAAWISRWSMLDVCIVALLVVALEGSLLTTADIHAGLVLFAAGVVVSTIATHRLVTR